MSQLEKYRGGGISGLLARIGNQIVRKREPQLRQITPESLSLYLLKPFMKNKIVLTLPATSDTSPGYLLQNIETLPAVNQSGRFTVTGAGLILAGVARSTLKEQDIDVEKKIEGGYQNREDTRALDLQLSKLIEMPVAWVNLLRCVSLIQNNNGKTNFENTITFLTNPQMLFGHRFEDIVSLMETVENASAKQLMGLGEAIRQEALAGKLTYFVPNQKMGNEGRFVGGRHIPDEGMNPYDPYLRLIMKTAVEDRIKTLIENEVGGDGPKITKFGQWGAYIENGIAMYALRLANSNESDVPNLLVDGCPSISDSSPLQSPIVGSLNTFTKPTDIIHVTGRDVDAFRLYLS
jgi:hypothetical protein